MRTFAFFTILFAMAAFASASLGRDQAAPPASSPTVATSPVAVPNEADMMKQMMDLSKLNENHKLLASLDGTWNYTIKFWMNPDPNAKPQESKGTAVRKSIMDGRYVMMDVSGKMQMPGENG